MQVKDFKKKLNNKKQIYLSIKVRPGAAKNKIVDIMADDTLKISIVAPAERGKANKELITYLAKEFSAPKDKIKIISGAGERSKLIKISL